MPLPGAFDDRFNRLKARRPSQFRVDFFRRGNQPCGIPRAAWLFDDADGPARDFLARRDDLPHACSAARAEVVFGGLRAPEREHVRLREVEDVDVIPDAGAIGSGVVGAENGDILFLAEGDFQNVRDKVCFDAVIFAKSEACACCVEVPEGHVFDPMDFIEPAEHLFKHQLRFAVGIDRALGQGFVNGHSVRCAEGGACGGEYDFFYPAAHHRFQQVQASGDVVSEIFNRIGHGFANKRIGGEVHHGIRLGVGEGVCDLGRVVQVSLDEFCSGVERRLVAFSEIIKNIHLMACVEQFFNANASDVPGSACDKNLHNDE